MTSIWRPPRTSRRAASSPICSVPYDACRSGSTRATRLGATERLRRSAFAPGRPRRVGELLGTVVGRPLLLGLHLLLRPARARHRGAGTKRRRAPGGLVDQAADLGAVDGLLVEQGSGDGVQAGPVAAQG